MVYGESHRRGQGFEFPILHTSHAELNRKNDNQLLITKDIGERISNFLKLVGNPELKNHFKDSLIEYQKNALEYYEAVKFSFTDAGTRKTRIRIMKSVIQENIN